MTDTLDRDEQFRSRVADGAEEGTLGRASWLYLVRPEGWEGELSALAHQVVEEQRDTDEARQQLSAQRRAEQLDAMVQRLRSDLEDRRSELDETERSLARERAARTAAEAERDDLRAQLDAAEAERTRAVRQLKTTESTATTRLEELRAEQGRTEPLRREVEQLRTELSLLQDGEAPGRDERAVRPPDEPEVTAPDPSGSWSPIDPDGVAAAIESAAAAAAELARSLSSAAAGLQRHGAVPPSEPVGSPRTVASTESGDQDAGRGPTPPAARVRPPRRIPVKLRGGVHDGSPEGLAQLLRVEGLVAIVDGYNVTMEGWPGLGRTEQRDTLVAALGGLQARVPAVLHVVFDGAADGRRPTVAVPLPVRLHFSPEGTEADDVILEMVASLPTDTAVVVVSSDRRVADGARRLGANPVRSSVLLELLRR